MPSTPSPRDLEGFQPDSMIKPGNAVRHSISVPRYKFLGKLQFALGHFADCRNKDTSRKNLSKSALPFLPAQALHPTLCCGGSIRSRSQNTICPALQYPSSNATRPPFWDRRFRPRRMMYTSQALTVEASVEHEDSDAYQSG
jgi:hypothetical protein